MRGREIGKDGIMNAQKNMAAKYQQIQKRIEEESNKISEMDFIGRSYEGNVTIKFTGEKKAVDIDIKKEEMLKKMVEDGLLKKGDLENKDTKEALFSLIDALSSYLIVSTNDAIAKVDDETDRRISDITKGMHIAGLN